MKNLLYSLLLITTFTACQKEKIQLGTTISDTFFVENKGASMRVLVEGNIDSKTILLFVHGGPGSSAYFYNTDYISNHIESQYAVAYWDQRNAGASQGSSNGENLSLPIMTQDLLKVVQTLKYRYGSETNVFLLAHSFGGMLSTSFLTTENYQELIAGWIYCSASHNYPLNDALTKEALTFYANQEISAGNHTAEWQEIRNYCNNLPSGTLNLDQANQLNSYAFDAETYFEAVKPFSQMELIKAKAVRQHYAIISALLNHKYSQKAPLNSDLRTYDFSEALKQVNIPILTIYGQYDFICPPSLGQDLINNSGSTDTFSFILPNSGHTGMFQDEALFSEKVLEFIGLFE